MNDKEQLFLDTVADLRTHIKTGTSYKLKRASGLLRQLLIDATSLLSQVNRKYRLKIRFPVGTVAPLNPHPNSFMMRGFGPTASGQLILATQDRFLGCHCLAVQGRVFSVCDIIKVTANIRGGVHAGGITTSEELVLLSAADSGIECGFATGGPVDPPLFLIVEITRTVLLALQPLENAILLSNSRT